MFLGTLNPKEINNKMNHVQIRQVKITWRAKMPYQFKSWIF
jgi:hypothetical protein